MSASFDISEEAERERPTLITPLLLNSVPKAGHSETKGNHHIITSDIVGLDDPHALPSKSIPEQSSDSTPSQRIVSLDVFRGLTVALMILVDDAGGAFPSINHSPWFGVTLADFVMPFFLFVVGFSIGLVCKKASNKSLATKKVLLRTIKLFLLGVLLQGGFFHGRHNLTYGVDIRKIRWLGVLQRISLGYFLASMTEIWLVNRTIVDLPAGFVRKYYVQWIFAIILCFSYLFLLYGLFIPSWQYDNPKVNLSDHLSSTVTIHCEVRGSLDPPCNAVGYLDRLILGQGHLYQHPVYRRKEECSVNSPDYGPLPPGSPAWCLAPFDPEGILSSLMAAVTCLVGLQFGHVFVHFSDHMQRLFLWAMFSFPILIVGYIMGMLGIPLSKPLYTLSYMCITAGASGLLLTIIFYIVDVKKLQKPLVLLQWMGMNALAVYALAACEVVPAALEGFYWRSPQNNLIDGTKSLLQALLHSDKWGTLMFVVIEIIFWGFFAGLMHKKGLYIKL